MHICISNASTFYSEFCHFHLIMIQITEYLYQALQNNYVGLGMYREWKKMEFPKVFLYIYIHKNPTRCNSMQSDLFYCKITVHVLVVHCIHRQEY